jgi:hybrid cluster-associated redox disulfide protein
MVISSQRPVTGELAIENCIIRESVICNLNYKQHLKFSRENFNFYFKKMEKVFELNEDSNIIEVAKNYPETAKIFAEYGIPCLGCAAARFERLSDIADEFGINVDELIMKIKETK